MIVYEHATHCGGCNAHIPPYGHCYCCDECGLHPCECDAPERKPERQTWRPEKIGRNWHPYWVESQQADMGYPYASKRECGATCRYRMQRDSLRF